MIRRGTISLKKKTGNQPQRRQDRLELEKGSYLKKWKGKTPIALVYPNSYAVGMSSLGFQLVYTLLNERDDIVCERFFVPEGKEALVSMESGRPLRDFPYIFFSISFEHDYLNLVRILCAGGVEPFASKRAEQSSSPAFILCGGVATFINPEPIAPFTDAFILGEAEPILHRVVDYLVSNHDVLSLEKLKLGAAQKFNGVYVPDAYSPRYADSGDCLAMVAKPGVPKRVTRLSLKQCVKAGHSELLTPAAEFSNLHLTELGRGCSRGCRFCAAGFIYRPPRLWEADAVVQAIEQKDRAIGRVGLLGMEMAENSTLDHISSYLLDSGCSLSFSSLRADRINDKLAQLLSNSALKSVAIAPDGTSERLRTVINKGLTEKDLIKGAVRLVRAGIFKLKLYVMIGLPTETCEDLQEFIDLVATIKKEIDSIGKERGRLTEIYLSVNCFIPKAWTPFQFHPFGINRSLQKGESHSLREALTNLKEKLSYLKKGVQSIANVHFQADKPDNAAFQALLARGDRRMADVLYDMVIHQLPWKKSLKKNDLSAEKFILMGTDKDSYFPWYIIDHGVKPDYLWKEYQKGLQATPTEPCDPSICKRCGVCGEI